AFGDAVGAEDRHRIGRHFGKVFDKVRAFGFETFHHVLVVHDLVAHIDRRTEFLQRPLNDFDGAHDARAKTTRLGQYHFHQDLPGWAPVCVGAFNSAFDPAASRRKAAGHGAFRVIYVALSGCGSSANPLISSLYLAWPSAIRSTGRGP